MISLTGTDGGVSMVLLWGEIKVSGKKSKCLTWWPQNTTHVEAGDQTQLALVRSQNIKLWASWTANDRIVVFCFMILFLKFSVCCVWSARTIFACFSYTDYMDNSEGPVFMLPSPDVWEHYLMPVSDCLNCGAIL